jgi:hypothetical protein
MAKISAQELAELVPCPLERVRRLADLGILASDVEGGLFRSSDVHVVRLMDAFEEAGISLEDVARGVAAGELSFPLELFLTRAHGEGGHLRTNRRRTWALAGPTSSPKQRARLAAVRRRPCP